MNIMDSMSESTDKDEKTDSTKSDENVVEPNALTPE